MIYVIGMVLAAVIGGAAWRLILALEGVQAAIRAVSEAVEPGTEPSWMDRVDAQDATIRNLEWLVDQLPQRWDEVVKLAKRSEERSRGTVKRALEELERAGYEHSGLEAEATELRLRDGGGSQGDGVYPMRASMEAHPAERQAVAPPPNPPPPVEAEDWRIATMRAKYARS